MVEIAQAIMAQLTK